MRVSSEDECYRDEFSELGLPVTRLKEALPVSELINKHQTEFEVKPDEDDTMDNGTSAESCFDFDELQKVINLNLIEDVELANGEIGTPFEKYRLKMKDIRGDGKLLKYIVKHGVGPLVPDNSVVYIRYQAHLEYAEIPFDSTLWQCGGKGDLPVPYNLGKGQILLGLHESILTMKKGEKAELLVHPDLAYGKMGCPPRIPGDSTILFIVEVDRFVDCGDIVSKDELSAEDRVKFSNAFKIAKACYLLGNDFFSKQNYNQALSKYRQAIDILHNSRLANEEEEKERNRFLLKNYSNACICYHKLKKFKKVCIMVSDAIHVDDKAVMKNPKLLYFWGYAKMILADYAGAKKHLLAAKKLAPLDKAVADALKDLETKRTNALKQEKMMSLKALGFSTGVTIKEVTTADEALRDSITQQLRKFIDSSQDILELKERYTSEEEQLCLQLAKEMNLYSRVIGQKRIIQIKKPDSF